MRVGTLARMCSLIILLGCFACTPEANTDSVPAPSEEPSAVSESESAPVASLDEANEDTPDGIAITIDVAELRSSNGMVQLTLYDTEDDFLSEDSETARIIRVEIEDEKSTCEFAGVQPGKYAIALMHDEDGDGEMKKNLIGIPKEGIGMSNDAKPKFGPPKWEDAVFEVGDEDVSLTISMLYM